MNKTLNTSARRPLLVAAAVLSTLTLGACASGDMKAAASQMGQMAGQMASTMMNGSTGDTVAVTAQGEVISVNRQNPSVIVTRAPITLNGAQAGETVVGIDQRPENGLIYAVGSKGTIFTLNAASGKADRVSTLMTGEPGMMKPLALEGSAFGVDFNPVADRLRVVGNTGQNLRINVDTGATIVDGRINPDSLGARISSVAYTNSVKDAKGNANGKGTKMYDIDAVKGLLHNQSDPNGGKLEAGVAMGWKATEWNGFDISGKTGQGFAVLANPSGEVALYTVNVDAKSMPLGKVGAFGDGKTALVGLTLKD
ncbi:DUF4394 domain-containing protein [Amphibiibacter pelophylacis]|uniref:DUF4394 domain-containing protein n=1 Tax=Amphibiibacter pelophylacis TaxID=1799477 RepID=A0ACC6P0C1_9BURK